MTAALRGLVCVGLLLAGCGGVRLPAPDPHEVDPNRGFTGDVIPITIFGEGFYPQVEADASRPDQADVNSEFSASLVGDGAQVDLEGVTFVDFNELTAEVPAGLLPKGSYDLVVTGPTGAQGVLRDAYTVTPTRAHALVVTAEQGDWTVNDTAAVHVQLVDTEGEDLKEDLDVWVVVSGDDLDPSDVTFLAGGLVRQESQGTQVLGNLGDGRGDVFLTVTEPQDITTVTVSPVDEGTGVLPGSVSLSWEVGTDLHLEFELPDSPFTVRAGARFGLVVRLVDQFGNEVTDEQPRMVVIQDDCSHTTIIGELSGTETFPVTLTEACEDNYFFLVHGGGMKAADTPYSALFDVVAGPVDHLRVDLFADTFIAGGLVTATVTALDLWDNITALDDPVLEIEDSVDGFIPCSDCCSTGDDRQFICQVEPTVAGEDIVLMAKHSSEATGESDGYVVLPGDPDSVSVSPGSVPWVAGEDQAAQVSVYDSWDNLVPAADLDPDEWRLTDPDEEITCSWDGTGPLVADFTCVAYDAEWIPLEVYVPVEDEELYDSTALFEVENGPLDYVEVTADPASVAVEATVYLTIDGYDAWGNAYVSRPHPDVDLDDTSGTISHTSATIGATGRVIKEVSFTKAGTTVVEVSQSGSLLGTSNPIEVSAGDAAQLLVAPADAWAWVGSGFHIDVTAVDEFDNVADVDDTVTLSAASGVIPDSELSLVAGEGSAMLTWDEATLSEAITAETDDLSGTSSTFIVVEDCGDDGPSIDLAFGGLDYAVACFDSVAGTATLTADLSGSSSSASRYGVAVDSEWEISSSDSIDIELDQVGVYTVRAVVADASGCGEVASSTAWVGPDDGQPVGPLTLSTLASQVVVGTSGSSTTTVYVEDAEDCAGDPAAWGTVYLRTDRGALTGTTTSGSGLYLTLDSVGDASATLDVTSATTGGTGTVYAWVASGTALGDTSLDVDGDDRRPVVWEQTPSGDELGLVDEIELLFSEDLLSSEVTTDRFTLTESGGDSIDIASVSLDGAEVVLTLDESADGSDGTWTLTASQQLRDLASALKLDGGWTGSAGDYTGTFGDLASGVDEVDTCEVDPSTFRPDGDAGVGSEADSVTLDASSSTTPSVWIFSVYDADGALILRERDAGTGKTVSWTWDGQDVDEQIVDNGVYSLEVDTGDGYGNRGGSCSTQVTVDNQGGS